MGHVRRDPEKTRAWRLRSRRLRPVSRKRKAWLADYAKARARVQLRSYGFCEAKLTGCKIRGTQCHHRGGRTAEDANDVNNLMWVCWHCHRLITDHDVPVYDLGLSTRRVGTFVPGRVASPPSPTSPAGDDSTEPEDAA